jgi:ABC-type transport system substrate-binding protein
VWVARGAETVRVDPASGRVESRIATPLAATTIVFARGAVWAASAENGRIVKIDPATNRITASTPLHGTVTDMAVDNASVWVSIVPDDVVYRLSPDDGSVLATMSAGAAPSSLSIGARLWIADPPGRQIIGLDAGGGRERLATTGSPGVARFHDGLLWVSAGAQEASVPASTAKSLSIPLSGDAIGSADPAVSGGPVYAQLAYSTCSYLLNYPDAAGAAGRTLRPEVAAAPPDVSRDGRTYTFRIRSGFRFSPPSGQRVTAETFRYSIERALSPRLAVGGPSPATLLADVVGIGAFTSGRVSHISGIRVRGDELAITLTRAAGDLPARLRSSSFCPVPLGTQAVPGGGGATPIAMAGPYYVASTGRGRTVLERNPNYTGSRPRRSARIVYTVGISAAAAIARVERGRADYVSGNTVGYEAAGPLAPGGTLDRAYGRASPAGRAGAARYVATDAPGIDGIAFNTRRPLFRDARMRRAVAYALDRRALAGVFGERPSDRLVPPAVSGLDRTLAYAGGPDLAAARRLAGHGMRRTAVLYVCGEPSNRRIAEIVRANLSEIGIDVHIDQSLGCLNGPEASRLAAADLQLVSRFDGSSDPAPFVELALGDRYSAPGYWGDVRLRNEIERARATRGAARIAAYSRLEALLVRTAVPLAVYGSAVTPEFFSARVGCRISQGALDLVDLGALCVRA